MVPAELVAAFTAAGADIAFAVGGLGREAPVVVAVGVARFAVAPARSQGLGGEAIVIKTLANEILWDV